MIILSLSALTSGSTLSANAQTTHAYTIRSNSKSSVDFLNRGRERFQYANAYFHRAGARYGIGDEPGTIQDLQLAAKLFRSKGDTKSYQQAQNLIRRLQHSIE